MSSVVTGPLGEVFGRDPGVFVNNLARQYRADLARLASRVARRMGMDKWTVTRGGKRYTIDLDPGARASAGDVARAIVGWALKAPRQLADEAARQAMGLPVAPRQLDDDGEPDAYARQLGAQWGSPEAGEPITIMAVLTIAVPIIIAIAPQVLSMIMSATGLGAPAPEPAPSAGGASGSGAGGGVGGGVVGFVDSVKAGEPGAIMLVAAAALAVVVLLRR